VLVKVGDKVVGGESVLVRYKGARKGKA